MDATIDLETYGLDSNSAIIAIGVTPFTRGGQEDFNQLKDSGFYVTIDATDQIEKGAVMDPETIRWWLGQSALARQEFEDKGMTTTHAILELNLYLDANNITNLWGNGSSFDNVIVRNMYKRMGHEFPLPFWSDRDMRTIKDVVGMDPKNFVRGVEHHALDDATHEALYLQSAIGLISVPQTRI